MIRFGNEEEFRALPNTIEAWVEPFANIGISAELLQKAFPELPLPNLFELYQNAERLYFEHNNESVYHTTWQLHCLTAEPTLTEDEIAQLDHLSDNERRSPLHYLALAGSTQAIISFLEKYPRFKNRRTVGAINLLHFAALSGSPQTIQLVLEKFPKLANSTDDLNRNLLHYAAFSGSPEAIRFLLTTHPQFTKKLWLRSLDFKTPDSIAFENRMSPSPRQIKRSLFSEITTDILNQNPISENHIDFLDAFHTEWQSFLIDSNPEDLPKEIASLPQYVPEQLLPHIHHIQELINLKGFLTQPLPLSETCLEKIIALTAPAEKQVLSTLWISKKSILLKTLQKLLNQWRMFAKKNAPNLKTQIAHTIKVIIDDQTRARINDDTRELDSLIIRALRAIPEIAALNPSKKVAEGMDISPDNYQQHFDAVAQAVDSVAMDEETQRTITETLLPGIQNLINDQEKIIQHVTDHYGQLYFLSEDLPLHTDHVDRSEPEKFRDILNRILVNFFGMFYTCQKVGRLPELFSKLSSGYCLEGRIRDTLEWTTSLAEPKDFNTLMKEVTTDYEAYQTIMLDKTNEEITQIQPTLKFIMERYKDFPCKQDDTYAPDRKIQEDKVREYLIDILGYDIKPDSGCVIS